MSKRQARWRGRRTPAHRGVGLVRPAVLLGLLFPLLAAPAMAQGPEGSGRERVLEEVRRLYKEAKAAGEKVSADLNEWVRQEIARLGTWEYTVLTSSLSSGRGRLREEMNALGRERWECVGAATFGSELVLVFKRPARSYLRDLPARDLLRLLQPEGQ